MRQPSVHAARLRLDIAPARFVVLCVGPTSSPIAGPVSSPIMPRDGIDTVILACAMLREQHGVDAMLVVVGGEQGGDSSDDLERARLHQLTRELDVARHIRFAARPAHAVLNDYHAAADVFASMPWHASPAAAGAVTMAMTAALPVVTAATGPIAAMVRDGVTGYLVPSRDPDTLCRCLARLQRQPLQARAMGMAGQAHASTTPHRRTPA